MPTRLTARAILFDMDGTLVDSTHIVEQIWGQLADKHGVDLGELLATSHGVKAIDTIRRYFPALHAEDALAELVAYELTQTEGIVEIPGAVDFVSSIPPGGFAIVTSATSDLAAMRLGLVGIPTPPVLVGADHVERGKPNPDPYLQAAAELGVQPHDCVVFEDADAGIQAGLAAGMRVVVVGSLATEVAEGLPRITDYTGSSIDVASEGFDIVLG